MQEFRFGLLWAAVVLAWCLACKTGPSTVPPNFAVVEQGLVRSGQPTTPQQWRYIKQQLDTVAPGKVHHVVKLNFPGEGTDDGALLFGMIVDAVPLQPEGDVDIFDQVKNSFVEPSQQDLDRIEKLLEEHLADGELVHCTHGQDRTGLAVARWRVIHDGWIVPSAEKEMLQLGFHPELHGLEESWEAFTHQK